MPGRRILIVGGDSTLGLVLASAHRKLADEVFVTSRRSQTSKDIWPLDLAKVTPTWRPPTDIDAAYLCGAITSLRACEEHPEESAQVNVTGTLTVAKALMSQGAFVSFLSTNLVFDGTRSHAPAEAMPSPRCEYGRQKVMVENALREHGSQAAIVRATKIISPKYPLFTDWLNCLRQGKPISPFSDMVMAPVSIAFACNVLLTITNLFTGGITHISASEDIGYVDAARHLAKLAGASPSLVLPIAANALKPAPYTPTHTTLAPTGENQPPSPFQAVDEFFASKAIFPYS